MGSEMCIRDRCAATSAGRFCNNIRTVITKEASPMTNVPAAYNISFGDSMKSETVWFSVGCCTFQPFGFGRETDNIYHVQRIRNTSGAHDGATTKTRRHYSNDTLHVYAGCCRSTPMTSRVEAPTISQRRRVCYRRSKQCAERYAHAVLNHNGQTGSFYIVHSLWVGLRSNVG